MLEFDIVTLEDNIEYVVLAKIENNGNKYVYLSQVDDDDDFCIRKEIIEDNKTYFTGLNDEDEFKLALELFGNKMNN